VLARLLLWGKGIKELREGLIAMAGITYIVGYLVWSYQAWNNGLGLLPAIQAQYFVAGLVPLLILFLAWLTIKGALRIRRKYIRWFEKDWEQIKPMTQPPTPTAALKLRLAQAIFISMLITMVGWLVALYLSDDSSGIDSWWVRIFFIWLVLFLFSPISRRFSPIRSRSKLLSNISQPGALDALLSQYQTLAIVVSGILYALIGILLYVLVLYPNIPQEFGGVQPRNAYLDITLDSASSETLKEIAPEVTPAADSMLVRSEMVDVYFVGSQTLLVKAHGQKGRDTPTYEIQRDVIKTITWSR
jgi:hypothetical protein